MKYVSNFLLAAETVETVPDWVAASFPVIRFVLLILMALGSIFMIGVVLFQSGNDEGLGALGGSNDTFMDKNKSTTFEEMLKKITVITAIALMVICVLFFITVGIYTGASA